MIPSRFLSISRASFQVKFDSCPIPLNQSNFDFKKHIGIRSDFFIGFFVYLFDSFLDLFSLIFFFFCHFLGQRFKGFLHTIKVRLFWPFFFIKLHVIMHFSCIFEGFSHISKFGVFDVYGIFDQNWTMGFFIMHHLNMIPIL